MTKNHSQSYRSGCIIIDKNASTLVLQMTDGSWVFPSLHRREFEDPQVVAKNAAQLAITSGNLTLLDKLGTYQRFRSNMRGEHRSHVTLYVYYIDIISDFVPDQYIDSVWVTLEDAAALLTNEDDKKFTTEAIKSITKLIKKEVKKLIKEKN